MRRGSTQSLACLLVGLLLSCAASPRAKAPMPEEDPLEPLPSAYAECVAAGGELESRERGGRCYAYYTPRWDVSAYARCRDLGGVPRLVGPGRRVAGQSHVCTLVFAPDD